MVVKLFGENSPEFEPAIDFNPADATCQCLMHLILNEVCFKQELCGIYGTEAVAALALRFPDNFKCDGNVAWLDNVECDLDWDVFISMSTKEQMAFLRDKGKLLNKFFIPHNSDFISGFQEALADIYLQVGVKDRKYLEKTYGSYDIINAVVRSLYNKYLGHSKEGKLSSSDYDALLKEFQGVKLSYYSTLIDITGADHKLDKRQKKLKKYLMNNRFIGDFMLWCKECDYTFRVFTLRPIYEVLPELEGMPHCVARVRNLDE